MTQDVGGADARTLVIVRHAKAEAQAASDHARPLTEKGLSDARAAGTWLSQRLGEVPEESVVGLVSTATRARLTWQEVSSSVPARTRMLDGLYRAGAGELIETVGMVDDTVRVAIVVAHNPTVAEAVQRLSDASTAAHEQLQSRGFPTCAVAVLRVDGAWHELSDGSCALTDFHVARG